MYYPKYWLIKTKNYSADLQKYTNHVIAETREDAQRVAEALYGPDSLECDPVLDPPNQ